MKKFIILSAILLSMFITNQAIGQWEARYNGPGNKADQARAMTIDAAGNIYVTGPSEERKGNIDFATVKYNTEGVQQWVARYNGAGNEQDRPSAITVDNKGNVYVTGQSKGTTTGIDYVTIKYKDHGVTVTQEWAEPYNGELNLNDFAADVQVDANGDVYVTGSTDSYSQFNLNGQAYTTIKYRGTDGYQLWARSYDVLPDDGTNANNEAANSLVLDIDNNVYVTGKSNGTTTVKYDINGQEQWSRKSAGSYGRKVLVDIANNIVVTGWGSATTKYNASGDLLWQTIYPGNATFQDMALDNSGNVYVVGYSRENGTSDDYRTVKYNTNGELQWSEWFNGDANGIDLARAIALDGNGNVYITGQCVLKAGRNTNENYATVKYNNTGDEQWVIYYDGPEKSADRGFDITVDGSGNVYVTGESAAKTSSFDFATVKYSQNTGSKGVMVNPLGESPASFQLKNYPNPFSQNTTIEFRLPQEEKVKLTVYDLMGHEVTTLVNETKVAGVHIVNFSANKLLPGTYFYRIQAGEIIESRKLVILK